MVTASDGNSDGQRECCLRWCCDHKAFGLLDRVARFFHLLCSFDSECSVCVEGPPGTSERIGKAVCSANFVV